MKKLIICLCFICCACSTIVKEVPVPVEPPVYEGIPYELTNTPDSLPYINLDTASQDDIAIWIGELWKRYTKLNQQRASIRVIDDKFKELYAQYLIHLKKEK